MRAEILGGQGYLIVVETDRRVSSNSLMSLDQLLKKMRLETCCQAVLILPCGIILY